MASDPIAAHLANIESPLRDTGDLDPLLDAIGGPPPADGLVGAAGDQLGAVAAPGQAVVDTQSQQQ